jgi:hypothetical protein
MRVGSRSLGEFPLDVVRIGAAIALPDLLVALSSRERRADFSKPCGARYADLAQGGPLTIR